MNLTTNLTQLCRLCVRNKGPMKNVFSTDTDLIELNVKLYCCVPSIKIDDPNLPSIICIACIIKLRQAFNFRQQCLDSTRILINKYKQSLNTSINISDDDDDMEMTSQLLDVKKELLPNPVDSSRSCTQSPTTEIASFINKSAIASSQSMNETGTGIELLRNIISDAEVIPPQTKSPVLEKSKNNYVEESDSFYDSSSRDEASTPSEPEGLFLKNAGSSRMFRHASNIKETTSNIGPSRKNVKASNKEGTTSVLAGLFSKNVVPSRITVKASNIEEAPLTPVGTYSPARMIEETSNIIEAPSKLGSLFPKTYGPVRMIEKASYIEETTSVHGGLSPRKAGLSRINVNAFNIEEAPSALVGLFPRTYDPSRMIEEASTVKETTLELGGLSPKNVDAKRIETSNIEEASSILDQQFPRNDSPSKMIVDEASDIEEALSTLEQLLLKNDSLPKILVDEASSMDEAPSSEDDSSSKLEDEASIIAEASLRLEYTFPRIDGSSRTIEDPVSTVRESPLKDITNDGASSIEETSSGLEDTSTVKDSSTRIITEEDLNIETTSSVIPGLSTSLRKIDSGLLDISSESRGKSSGSCEAPQRFCKRSADGSLKMSQGVSYNIQTSSILEKEFTSRLEIASSIEDNTTSINQDGVSSIESPINGGGSPAIDHDSAIFDNEHLNNSLSRIIITSPRTITESPSNELISTRVAEDYLQIVEEDIKIEDETSIIKASPIIQEEQAQIVITPSLINIALQIEASATIEPTSSQIEAPFTRIEEVSSVIHSETAIIDANIANSLPQLNTCANLEALITNAFKTLQPSEVNQDSIRIQNDEQIDEFINENIAENWFDNEHDHTYCKHRDKEIDDELLIKSEEDANQNNIDLIHKVETISTNVEMSNTKLVPSISKIPVDINFTAKKCEANNYIANNCNASNFTAKRCEVINDSELESPYICTSCDIGFHTIAQLRAHLRSHIKKYKATCKKCGTSTPTQALFMTHRCAGGVSEFNCTFCAMSYKSAAGLFKHKYEKHIKVHVCPYCFTKFTDTKMLNKHIKTHTRELQTQRS